MKFSINQIKVGKQLAIIIWLAVIVAVVQAGIGLYELTDSNNSLKTVYEDRMIPVRDLGKIRELILENKVALGAAVGEVQIDGSGKKSSFVMNPQTATKSADLIEHNIETVTGLWKGYMATYLTPEEKILAEKFAESCGKFVNEGLKPAVAALRANNYQEARRLSDKAKGLDVQLDTDAQALINLQLTISKQKYDVAESNFTMIRLLTFGGLVFAIALLSWIGLTITRAITKPLKQTIEIFDEITQGKYDTVIEVKGNNELSQVLSALKNTQEKLSENIAAQQEQSDNFKDQAALYEGQLAAISNSTGVIEFSMDGKVIAANDIFLNVLGYSRDEAVGQPHSAFVDSDYRNSVEYRQFWEKLNRGEFQVGQYKRIGKGGKEIWIQASYNPILCKAGKPYKVVKYATDITAQKMQDNDFQSQIEAIQSSQGVVELDIEGKITKANQVYLNMLGYAENELIGKHVSVVLDPTYAKSADYAALWQRLLKGESIAAQVKRIAKSGKEVWIQAYYNTINDLNGKPFKIVNYTTDVTAEKLKNADFEGQLSAIGKIQGVIEFTLDGKITKVNDNFANVTGYSEKEIVGNHHGMFVEPAYRTSQEYKAFWDRLGRGEAEIGQYKRIGKGGKEIWLQASYNPIFDMNGKTVKVVKFATDVSEQVNAQQTLSSAVEESQEIIQLAKVGDLTQRVPLEGKTGAISALCDGINALMDKMTEVVVQVKEAGETISTAAGEIASGNNDLSSRTEQQASSLEETASSMEELASTVKQNAENAKQANQMASAASDVAIKGGEVVSQVVNTMSAINESARKIEDIISVIDGIAFQTNILALNAAVEAARAGEQGRGFAVVAGEVRNLAQRSATAAKEIKELITDSVSKTAEGTAQVENAGRTMEEIVSSVQRVTDIMGEISAASSEQSAGIDQVNNAITSMDEVTQQNAALVEEAAAAAESLVEQSVNLMDTVNEFRLKGGESYDRRTSSSAMRATSRAVVAKSPSKPTSANLMAKTGTDDGAWEEF